MNRTATKHTKKAIALTNPNPSYVSIVKAGANMTPFLAVKSAEGTTAQEAPMKVKKSDTHDIASILFKKAAFADETAVKSWLDAGGYEDYTIVAKGEDFEVAGVEGLSDIKTVESDGVVISTGKREAEQEVVEKTEEEKAKEAEAASAVVVVTTKEDEKKLKGDETLLGSNVLPAMVELTAEKSVQLGDIVAHAHKASELSVDDWNALKDEDREAKLVASVEALKAAEAEAAALAAKAAEEAAKADATVAPTTEEVVGKATALILKMAEADIQVPAKKGMYTVSELGYTMANLKWLLDDAQWNGLSDEAVSNVKVAAQALLSVLVEAMQGVVDNYVEAFKAEAVKAEAEKTEKSAKSDEPEDKLTALMARMDLMDGKITELTTENEALKAEKTVSEQKVKSLEEDQRQTRKSADAADAAAADQKDVPEKPATKSASEEVSQLRTRSILGIL